MRSFAAAALCLFAVCCLAESRNPADYPLRIHIFGRSETNFYYHRMMDEAKGDGRADLFEDNHVHGVDFSYDCEHKLRASFGPQTYPARWLKPGRKLVVLLPVFGKAGAFWTCKLNTDVKAFVYFRGRNGMGSTSEQKYLHWMARHDYDPVHGKDVPMRPASGKAAQPVSSQH